MREDNEGFLYPHVDKSQCIDCRKCEKVCPILNKSELESGDIQVYACKNRNEDVREKSSSGGLFFLLAEQVINAGGVVFGAVLDKEFRVVHDEAKSIEEVSAMRGSKYVQSQIDRTYNRVKEYLIHDKFVLFSGTPCQISGLKRFLYQNYDKLITVDIICHGVPSQKVFDRYLQYIKKEHTHRIKNICFREKTEGWKKYGMSVLLSNGRKINHSLTDDLFLKGFLNNLYLRPSCHNCDFKDQTDVADITLGDYWGIETLYPDFDDDKGVSAVITRTEKGRVLFHKVKSGIIYKSSTFEHAARYNPCLNSSVKPHKHRKKFFENIDRPSEEVMKLVVQLTAPSYKSRFKKQIKSLIGLK